MTDLYTTIITIITLLVLGSPFVLTMIDSIRVGDWISIIIVGVVLALAVVTLALQVWRLFS